jgi:acetyl-CoA acetyltransferase
VSRGIKDQAAIVGIGQTEFGKALDRSEAELACEAIRAALTDAGIAPSDVDGMVSFTQETTDEVDIARNLGFGDVRYFGQIGYGGGGGCATIAHAATAISGGQASVAVAWRSRKRGSGPRPWANASGGLPTPAQWTKPWGVLRPADEIALLARRYMHEYGISRDHLANVALACRRHANRNPAALMNQRTLSRDEYMQSRWISEPLCLFDNCLESDGAVAVVLTSADRAVDSANTPAYVHAASQGLPAQHQTMVNYFCSDPLRGPSHAAGAALWRSADVTPDEIDVAQIYDAFTPLVLMSLEGYGFCERGEAGSFSDGENLVAGIGRLPLNTSGGSLSEAYIHGFNLITEGVRQVRGTSTAQVDGAQFCFVSSGEGVPTSALILRAGDA